MGVGMPESRILVVEVEVKVAHALRDIVKMIKLWQRRI